MKRLLVKRNYHILQYIGNSVFIFDGKTNASSDELGKEHSSVTAEHNVSYRNEKINRMKIAWFTEGGWNGKVA